MRPPFFCVMSIAFFYQKFTQKSSPKAYFRLFFHFLTEIAIKSKQNRGRIFQDFWIFCEKKRGYEARFFPLNPSCGMYKKISTWNWSFVRAKFFCTTFSTTFALWTIFCWILSQWHWRMSLLLQNIWSFAENAKWLFG